MVPTLMRSAARVAVAAHALAQVDAVVAGVAGEEVVFSSYADGDQRFLSGVITRASWRNEDLKYNKPRCLPE